MSETLVKVVNKRMMPTFRSTRNPGGPVRMEVWGADSADGVWHFSRSDSRGTPWMILHRPTGQVVCWASSLKRCRVLVGSGQVREPVAA